MRILPRRHIGRHATCEMRCAALSPSDAVIVDFRLNDVVRLRKPHPCGGAEWRVVRLGADIGLKCLKCQRRVLLPRSELERRMKGFVSRAEPLAVDSQSGD